MRLRHSSQSRKDVALATIRPDSEPHVIPVCPVLDRDAMVYVDIRKRYATADGLRASPSVAVLIDQYFDDWTKLKGGAD